MREFQPIAGLSPAVSRREPEMSPRPIRRGDPARFSAPLPAAWLAALEDDLRANAGFLAPGPAWRFEERFGAERGKAMRSSFHDMLRPWIGENGRSWADEALHAAYAEFLRGRTRLGLLEDQDPTQLLRADYGTVLDLELLAGHLRLPGDRPLRVLEVGGGYGRLAEGLAVALDHPVEHILLDAVPESLCLADLYLREALPHLRIGAHHRGDAYQPGRFDVYLLPTWRITAVLGIPFDLCVNIESMQEMQAQQVEFFLRAFDAATAVGGLLYLSNSRDYFLDAPFPYPPHWRLLFKQQTPRSWTADHPTEIFEKTDRDQAAANRPLEVAYALDLVGRQAARMRAQRKRITELEAQLAERELAAGA